jgi:lysophospholipase L1-like esterase
VVVGWQQTGAPRLSRCIGPALTILLPLTLVLALLPASGPARAATLSRGGFITSATVSAASFASGDTVSIVVHVTSGANTTARVFVDLYTPTATVLNPVTFENEAFVAGVERTFPVTWQVPGAATAGGYSVEVRIFDPNVVAPLHVNDSAAFFTVGMAGGWPPGGPVRIMPLGDSLTDGYTVEGGYRIDLRTLLVSAPKDVDFVGSRYNGPPGLADKNHEGHVGWRIDELAGGITPWLRAYQPQIVLLMIGTDDMLQGFDPAGAPGRLGALIDQIKAALPGAPIVVSSLPRVSDADALVRIQTFNDAIPSVVAARGSTVTYVDAYTAIQPSHLDVDGVHLTTEGYSQLAQVWYPAVIAALGHLPEPTATFTPTATQTATSTQTPTPTLVPSPTSTPAPCAPRPPVLVSVRTIGGGRLGFTITATGAGNGLREIRVGAARNATIEIAGSTGAGNFVVPLPGVPASVQGTVTRTRAGEAVHVPLVVVDQCGEWQTFVGGGPNAF